METVSEPDIRSAGQAEAYILELQSTMRYLGISTANMEEGSFRCDANVSIRPKDSGELRTRVEVKNMNRVRAVVRAIEYEIDRQTGMAEAGERLEQETRGWDDEKGVTLSQRSKEEANDYRYFPEPDLPPLYIDRALVEEIRASIPELAGSRRVRFENEYGLSSYDTDLLTARRETADYFESVVLSRHHSGDANKAFAKEAANWINGEMARLHNSSNGLESDLADTRVKPAQLATLVELFQTRAISNNAAKQVLADMFVTGRDPEDVVDEKKLRKVDDSESLLPVIDAVIDENPKAVDDYLSGKETAIKFLLGQVMKATRGAADANTATQLITERLETVRKA